MIVSPPIIHTKSPRACSSASRYGQPNGCLLQFSLAASRTGCETHPAGRAMRARDTIEVTSPMRREQNPPTGNALIFSRYGYDTCRARYPQFIELPLAITHMLAPGRRSRKLQESNLRVLMKRSPYTDYCSRCRHHLTLTPARPPQLSKLPEPRSKP